MLIDFNEYEKVPVYYGGDAGQKYSIFYDDSVWMLKFPKPTTELIKPQISYTTSPLSEYLGSKIYSSLGIPTHEVLLGIRDNKIVVACKDFTAPDKNGLNGKELTEFNKLKNAYGLKDSGSLSGSYTGSGSSTILDEVLDAMLEYIKANNLSEMEDRFWDMFVTDAFIGNNDRNNGNWGILRDRAANVTLAPVYDNGNAFFSKKGLSQMEKRLSSIEKLREDAYKTITSVYSYVNNKNEQHKLNPFNYISSGENEKCMEALNRFIERLDVKQIDAIFNAIPETYKGLAVMPRVQNEFYRKLLDVRLKEKLIPASAD